MVVGTRRRGVPRAAYRLNAEPGHHSIWDMKESGRLVVRHIFFGRSPAELAAIERAHARYDRSFRAARTGERLDGIRFQLERVNPAAARSLTKIYDRVLQIRARKGRRSQYPGQKFYHDFRSGGAVYGLPSGNLLIAGAR